MGSCFTCCKKSKNRRVTLEEKAKQEEKHKDGEEDQDFHKKFSELMGDQIYSMLKRSTAQFFNTYSVG